MNKEQLKATFRGFKKEAKADYAITAPDSLGDCMSCVNATLCDKYGEESKGIWAKAWKHGMNSGRDLAFCESVYIAHDLTEEQAAAFYKVFSKHYNITPLEYEPSKCFCLYEKHTNVYEVIHTEEWNGKEYTCSDTYTKILDATDRLQHLFNTGHTATLKRIF